jgi:hypothetical protein
LFKLVSALRLKLEEPASGLPVITFVSADNKLLASAKVEGGLVEIFLRKIIVMVRLTSQSILSASAAIRSNVNPLIG